MTSSRSTLQTWCRTLAYAWGTLYDPEDYPDSSTLREKFGIEMDILPVPTAQDFRVDVAESEINRIREEISRNVVLRQRKAMDDAWSRVHDVVDTIYLRLSADKPVIRDSLIENARELTALLPGLNVIDDPAMTAVAKEITDNLLEDV